MTYRRHVSRTPLVGTRSRALAWVAGLAVTAPLAGCGGAAYGKRDYVARAEAICASTTRHARAAGAPVATTGVALAAYIEQLLPLVRGEAAQLRGLRRPPGPAAQRAQLSAFLRALDASLAEYAALAAAARRGDTAGVARAESALRANAAGALAARYGITGCGAPTSTSA